MDAKKDLLLTFLSERIQLHIPLYQRNYSWTKKECKVLLDDIINIGESDEEYTHFLGAVVYLKEYKPSISPIDKLTLIDGQQRITTIMLLISAISSYINQNKKDDYRTPDYLSSYYLINEREKDFKYKIILSDYDNKTLRKIIDNIGFNKTIKWNSDDSQRLKDNFEFFIKSINENNIEKVYDGLSKLIIILIALEPNLDNPQLIFESLNSTGKELNKSDLIRNYLLMGLEFEQQEQLYSNYWKNIENGFRNSTDKDFDNFIKYYLTIKFKGTIPTDKELYSSFKNYASTIENKEDLVKDMYKYANYLFKIINSEESDGDLLKQFSDLKTLKVNSINSFLLNVYDDYDKNLITKIDFLEILNILESYIIRRDVSGFTTNYYNQVFGKLYWDMDKSDYIKSFKKTLLLNNSASRKFPTDIEILQSIKNIDITKDKHFILSKIENHMRVDPINLDEYKVEHILPYKSNLNDEWIEMLGEDYLELQKNYASTLGNLTLLPKAFKDESFNYKCNNEQGYRNSSLKLNENITNEVIWNKERIIERTNLLYEHLIEIWKYPDIKFLSVTVDKKKNNVTKTQKPKKQKKKKKKKRRNAQMKPIAPIKTKRKSIKYLDNNSVNTIILNALTQKIFSLNNNILQDYQKDYVAFILNENEVVKMIPKKDGMEILLTAPINKINDSENKCIDISHNNQVENTKIIMNSINDVNYVFHLIKQSYDYLIY